MLCAGVTTYAALRKSKAKSGDWVVIAGAGGGLGHIACQLASRGMAMRVIGIDAPAKKSVVMDCGAEHFVDVTAHDDKSIAEEVLKLTGGLGASAVIVCTLATRPTRKPWTSYGSMARSFVLECLKAVRESLTDIFRGRGPTCRP